MHFNFNQIVIRPGHQILLKDINWFMFETLVKELGNERASRISYSKGMLEIMTPLAVHEDNKTIIGNLVEIILEELEIEFRALGSTLFQHEAMNQAIEPDECFYIQQEAQIRGKQWIDLAIDPPPDLAIEIDLTYRTHFDNYEQLGIPELWRYNGEQLEISVLQNKQYICSNTSPQFPSLPIQKMIPHYIKKSQEIGRNGTMKEFRAWVKEQISSN